MAGLFSAGAIPFSKVSISNVSGHGTYVPLVVANQYVAGKLTPALLTSISDSGLGCVGYANLDIAGSQPTSGQILSYNGTKLSWTNSPASLTLNQGEIQIGDTSNAVVKKTIYGNANILDLSYYQNNLDVPLDMVLTTNLLANSCKWSKIY